MIQKLFNQFFPDPGILAKLTVPILILSVLAAFLAGWMKAKKNIRTPYTRKTFHFIIFSAAGIIQYYYGLRAVSLLGVIVSFLVLTAVIVGQKFSLYNALARETDAPHEKKFILFPLIATALGGIVSNIFFPLTAYIGYFVGGWGDAVGEPVGTKWGRHRYTVPTMFGVKATRSIEGSFAVLFVSSIISFICLVNIPSLTVNSSLIASIVCGVVAASVEAISSHGLDNFTIQLCASGVLSLFLHWYS